MYQHCQNPFAIKQWRKSVDISPKSCFWASKQLFAIHFLLATCNVCPLTIPEFFAQTRVSDYWQLIHSVGYHKSDNKIGRPRSGSSICLSRVWLQSELDDTKSYHQLIIKITISEKRRIASYERKGKFALKYLQRRCKHSKATAPPTGN